VAFVYVFGCQTSTKPLSNYQWKKTIGTSNHILLTINIKNKKKKKKVKVFKKNKNIYLV